MPDGNLGTQHTALCCQAICFIKLDNMRSLTDKLMLPPDVSSEIVKDLSGNDSSLILVLVRWFEAHPSATERDSRNLPLCPGNLNVNHCLWRFAMCSRDRPYLLQKKTTVSIFQTSSLHVWENCSTTKPAATDGGTCILRRRKMLIYIRPHTHVTRV